MSITTKILLFLLAIFVVGTVGFIIYKQMEISKKQELIESQIVEQKQLADNIVRAMSKFADKKDIEEIAKNNNINLEVIKKDLDKLNAKLNGIGILSVNSLEQHQNNISSTITRPNDNKPENVLECKDNKCEDKFGYLKNVQKLELNEDFSTIKVPLAGVEFDASKEKPWNYNIYGRQYNVINVDAENEDGKRYIYSKVSVKINDKEYSLPINKNTYVQEYQSASFHWWNPRAYLNVSGGINIGLSPVKSELNAGVSFSFMDYGKTKTNPDWTFANVGVGYGTSSEVNLNVNPVNYNLGQHLSPAVRNTYVGPNINLGLASKNATIGLSVSVGF